MYVYIYVDGEDRARDGEDICVYISMNECVYVYIYMCMYICMCMYIYMCIQVSPSSALAPPQKKNTYIYIYLRSRFDSSKVYSRTWPTATAGICKSSSTPPRTSECPLALPARVLCLPGFAQVRRRRYKYPMCQSVFFITQASAVMSTRVCNFWPLMWILWSVWKSTAVAHRAWHAVFDMISVLNL